MYIAEQQLVSAAVASRCAAMCLRFTFAAFSRGPTTSSGWRRSPATPAGRSHAGSEIGADGPSQMALEDLRRCGRPGSTVLYPSDAVSTVNWWPRWRPTGIVTPDHPQRLSGDLRHARPSRSAAPRCCGAATRTRRGGRGRVTLHSACRRRPAGGGGYPRPGDRLLLGQADRRRRAGRGRPRLRWDLVVVETTTRGRPRAAVMEALAGDTRLGSSIWSPRRAGKRQDRHLLAAEGIDADAIVRAARHAATTSAEASDTDAHPNPLQLLAERGSRCGSTTQPRAGGRLRADPLVPGQRHRLDEQPDHLREAIATHDYEEQIMSCSAGVTPNESSCGSHT